MSPLPSGWGPGTGGPYPQPTEHGGTAGQARQGEPGCAAAAGPAAGSCTGPALGQGLTVFPRRKSSLLPPPSAGRVSSLLLPGPRPHAWQPPWRWCCFVRSHGSTCGDSEGRLSGHQLIESVLGGGGGSQMADRRFVEEGTSRRIRKRRSGTGFGDPGSGAGCGRHRGGSKPLSGHAPGVDAGAALTGASCGPVHPRPRRRSSRA